MAVEIIKVTKQNYELLAYCINWRSTGIEPDGRQKYEITFENDVIDLFDLIDKNLMHLYIASCNNQPVGYISASVIPKPDKRIGTMFIDELWVTDTFRGEGIGRALTKKITDISEKMGLWRSRLYVSGSNDSGIHCYESVGMKSNKKTCYLYEK